MESRSRTGAWGERSQLGTSSASRNSCSPSRRSHPGSQLALSLRGFGADGGAFGERLELTLDIAFAGILQLVEAVDDARERRYQCWIRGARWSGGPMGPAGPAGPTGLSFSRREMSWECVQHGAWRRFRGWRRRRAFREQMDDAAAKLALERLFVEIEHGGRAFELLLSPGRSSSRWSRRRAARARPGAADVVSDCGDEPRGALPPRSGPSPSRRCSASAGRRSICSGVDPGTRPSPTARCGETVP